MLPLHAPRTSQLDQLDQPAQTTPLQALNTTDNITALAAFNLLFTIFFNASYTRFLDGIINLFFLPLCFYFLTFTCLRYSFFRSTPHNPNRNLINAHLAQRQQLVSMLTSSSASARRFARTVVRDEEFTGNDMGDLEENLNDEEIQRCTESEVVALTIKRMGREEESCVICTEECFDKDVLEMKCGHFACYECQIKWLREKGKCSVCMKELVDR